MASVEPLSFGLLLKRYRRAADLTQEALAARSGYSAAYISMIERGERAPQRATAELLCHALGLGRAERAELLSSIKRRPPTQSHRGSQAVGLPRLVGRAQEMEAIARHLEGQGPAMLSFAGEPGIGKTRLLREAARIASAAGWTVLEGGCHRSGGQQPYAPLLGALDRHIRLQPAGRLRANLAGCSWLVRLLPELAEATLVPLPQWKLPPMQERRLMFAAVGRFLANVAGPAGTLLILDDLQWADADAIGLLATVLRQSSDRPLRVIGAYRSTEVCVGEALETVLHDLAREGLAARHDLLPLLDDEAAALLGDQLSPMTADTAILAERLLARAGGVPFFLISLAQGVASGARDASAGEDGEDISADVAESIFQRLALLPTAAQDLLGVAAVVGRTVQGDLLAAASDLPEEDRIICLEAVCRARLLVEQGDDAYRFAHDLIREVVEAKLSTARRRMLHRRVAEALEQRSGAPVEQLAYHYLHSDLLDKALTYGLRAAEQAETRRALAEAEEHYRSAIALARKLSDRQCEATALERLGLMLDVTANMAQARETLEQAIQAYQAAGDDEGLRRSLARLSRVYRASGMPPEIGLARLEPFLPSLLDGEASAGRGMLHVALARLYVLSLRFHDALAEAERAIEIAQALGDRPLEAEAEHWRSAAFADLGQPEESLRAAEQGLQLAAKGGDLWTECFLLTDITQTHLQLGTAWQCQEAAERAVQVAQRMGMPGPLTYALHSRGEVAFHLGDWARARADAEQALALVRPLGTYWIADAPRVLLGKLCLAEGQWESGQRYVEEGVALAERMGESIGAGGTMALGRAALAENDLLTGRADRVIAELEPLIDGLAGTERGRLKLLLCLAWAYLDAGDPERATELLDDGLAHAQSELFRLTQMEVLLVRARVAIHQQQWAAAHAMLDAAIALARTTRSPYAEAKALYLFGLLHAAQGEVEAARERLEAALTILQRLGERLYGEHVERALADLAQC